MSIKTNQDSQSENQCVFNKDQLIKDFDNYLRVYKNVVESTIKNHHIYIKRFFDWFDNHQLKSLKEVNFENLNKFLSQYHNKYSPISIRKLHFSLRAFFEYCRIHYIIEYNFAPILPQRRVYSKSHVPAVLSKAEINLLITESEKNKSEIGQRNYAILSAIQIM
jgi:site-specific recombinase XerD